MNQGNLAFKDGGALDEHHFYIERRADQQLPSALWRGEFCYVLAPRQMGKSSLRYRVARQLSAQAVQVVTLDLTAIGGTTVSAEQWYYGLTYLTAKQVGGNELSQKFCDFWVASASLAPVQRFSLAMREIILGNTTGDIVIFIDEVDAVRVLPFSSDDFFAAVRAFYNARPDDAEYRRLRLCLLGVAQPGDLIRNEQITPFNIGTRIDLTDFERSQLDVFASGLLATGYLPQAVLDAIFRWTNGHPYMTQRLCAALVAQGKPLAGGRPGREAAVIRALVHRLFLRSSEARDANLAYAAKSFEKNNQNTRIPKMLDLYSRLLRGEALAADGRDEVQGALQLTGMVAASATPDGRKLRVRNRIFTEVFDDSWVRRMQADRYLSEPTARWLDSGRKDNFVLRGEELRAAEQWAEGREDLTEQEQQFLLACSRVTRVKEQAKLRARISQVLAVSVVILLLMLVVTLSQYIKADREFLARDKANRRLAEQLRAEIENKKREAALIAQGQTAERVRQGLEGKLLRTLHEMELVTKDKEAQLAERRLEKIAMEKRQAELVAQQLQAEIAAQKREAALVGQKQAAELLAQQRESVLLAQIAKRNGEALALAREPEKALAALLIGMEVASTERTLLSGSQAHLVSLQGLYVAGLRNVPMRLIRSLPSPVKQALYSPAGASIITTSEDGVLMLWSGHDGRKIPILGGEPSAVRAAHYCSPTQVIVALLDDGVGILNLNTGRIRIIVRKESFRCVQAQCSPDGRYVLLVGDDKEVRLQSLAALEKPPVAPGQSQAGIPVAMRTHNEPQEEGGVLADPRAFKKEQSSLKFLDRGTVDSYLVLRHDGLITSASFSPNSHMVLTTSNDKTARIWDAHSGKLSLVLTGHQGAVTHGCFSPDGQQVFTASQDRTARIYDVKTGNPSGSLAGHTDAVSYVGVSPDGKTAVTASADRTARLWTVSNGRMLQLLGGHTAEVTSASFSIDGKTVLTASRDQTIRAWAALAPHAQLVTQLLGHKGPVHSASFSPDGQYVVTAGTDQSVRIFRAQDGKQLHLFSDNTGEPTSARYSKDGQSLVVARRAGYAQILDARTGEERSRLAGHEGPVTYAEFSPNGRMVVTASEDKSARIWDLERGVLLHKLDSEHLDTVTHASFSPDGKRVVTSGHDDILCIWDTASGALEQVIVHPSRVPLSSAQFSPDGRFLALASLEPRFHLWNLSQKRFVRTFEGFRGALQSVSFSPDGNWVVAASKDGTAGLFKTTDDREVLKLQGGGRPLVSAEFSPDGQLIVTVGTDGVPLIHPISHERLLRHACCVLRGWSDFALLPVAQEDFVRANQACHAEWQRADCAEK